MAVYVENTVKAHREDMGWSQDRLAQALGVNRNTVSNWEQGSLIKSNNLMQLVALFGCDVNEVLGLKSDDEEDE